MASIECFFYWELSYKLKSIKSDLLKITVIGFNVFNKVWVVNIYKLMVNSISMMD